MTGDSLVNGYSSIRSRLNSLRDDVRRSAHLFRVRKLRYCLRQQKVVTQDTEKESRKSGRASFPQEKPRQKERKSKKESERPRSVMSDFGSTNNAAGKRTTAKLGSTESAGVIFGSSAAQARRKSLRSSDLTRSAIRSEWRGLSTSISPKFLKRSSIHELKVEDGEKKNNGMKRKLTMDATLDIGLEATEELKEPNQKKSRFWTSLMSMLGAPPNAARD